MKLSEAILLGSTVLAAKAGGQHFPESQSGCALGMAAVAKGGSFGPVTQPFHERDRRTLNAEGVWGDWVLRVVMRTCDCPPSGLPRAMRIKDNIAHLFDYHVMNKKDWTLLRLVAWVETWEPKPIIPEAPSSLVPRRDTTGDLREVAEWQAVRRAFAARHEFRQSLRASASSPGRRVGK